ncbi:multidrug transporter [Mesotoga sp. Brook.08.YT.4.2.5.1]|uniref:DMT(Drug/metabolite transporter) superfamily permease n=1 Tax=Mesotoga prima TaxID=1184387 RepID=A0A101HSH7_9BACT|nr:MULTISPECIES: DMT family transporter [unclassified Mesotoga]KUK82371.1 MAG: DMT(Drug/metabolite transporter) superfamily permease [Mesotoga prima]PNE23244.1 multidrug transporter [Mesotoga sp. Brook.08.YT.4.2.5.1]PVD17261.1 multidrug transporter [Mesotoga sp. Brook.08.105.5.1]RAO98004.1 multidrug transporter [Mesotoga sp. Brook.08.YT.4.2.5.4.]RDI94392.1 multidrug transporter [Mesotoga sp. Brook.08.YT.4.2.5.2.]
MDILKKKWIAALVAVFCSVLWGSAFPVLKLGYEEMAISPDDVSAKLVFAGIRFLGAGIMVLLLSIPLGRKGRVKFVKKDYMHLFALGVLQTFLLYFFFYNGLSHTTGMKSSIIMAGENFLVILLAHYIYKNDRLSWRKTLGMFLGFAGVFLANFEAGFTLSFVFKGDGFMLIAATIGALGTMYAKWMSANRSPFLVSGWQLSIGGFLLLVAGLPGLRGDSLRFTFKGNLLLLYSMLLSAVAFSLWYAVLSLHKAGEITMFRFVIPVAGVFLSAAFIPGEALNSYMAFALILVSAGIVVVNWKNRVVSEDSSAR